MILFLLPILGAIKSESYPKKLSLEEEKKYLELFHNNNDQNARDKLIEHNLRLVAHIAKKYENTSEDKDDILSIGILGLIKAVDTFQIKNGNTLTTYAARCIENEILMTLRSNKNKRKQRWYCVVADKYFFRSFFVPIITSVKIHMKILLIKKWMIQLLIQNLLFLMF